MVQSGRRQGRPESSQLPSAISTTPMTTVSTGSQRSTDSASGATTRAKAPKTPRNPDVMPAVNRTARATAAP